MGKKEQGATEPHQITIDATLADDSIERHTNVALPPKEIQTDEEYIETAHILRELKFRQKHLEEDRETIIRPIRKGLDVLYEKFRTAKETLKSIEKDLKGRIEGYEKKKAHRAIESAKERAAETDNAELAGDIVRVAQEQVHVPRVKGLSFKDSWDFEVEDSSLVPITFQGVEVRPVDEKALKDLVKLHKGEIEIPGVRVFRKRSSSMRVK